MFNKSNTATSESIFHLITDDITQQIKLDPLTLHSSFLLNQNITQKIQLILTTNYITIYQQLHYTTRYLYYAPLNFDLKFQVTYQQENASHSNTNSIFSKPIGFKLYKKNAQTLEFKIVQENMLILWIKYLSQALNQYGFHKLFKPVKKIGKGGFATVYQVQRVTDNKFFAVKAFSKQNTLNSSNQNHRLNLLNQIKMLRSFNHPNVIKLQGIFESDNSLYIVLELLSGGQMHSKINRREGKFTEKEIIAFMIGLTKGLKEMHDKGIMHRDIKPENIMLRDNNTIDPVIVDFGLAAEIQAEDYLFYRCGTPGYVAPQVTTLVKGQKISTACDIFSLGVIFHILLTAKPLFEGRKFDLVYQNNKKFKFDLQSVEYSQIDESAMDLLKKMLVLNPAQRITADQILEHQFLISEMQDQNKQMSPITTRGVSCYRVY